MRVPQNTIDPTVGCSGSSSISFSQGSRTFSSSTTPPSPIPSSSRTKFGSRSAKPTLLCPSWLSSPSPSSLPRSVDTQNSTMHHQRHLFNSTTSCSFPSSSLSPTCSCTLSIGVYTTLGSTSSYISRITSGSCRHHLPAMPSTPWTDGLKVSRTTFSPSCSLCRNSLTLCSSFLSTSGQSSSVRVPVILDSGKPSLTRTYRPDDGEYVSNSPIVNGAACHTMHHLYFNYNYGQFFTLWDRVCGSYRKPNEELFKRESKMSKAEWERQCKETERVQRAVEGEDDTNYEGEVYGIQKKVV